MSTITTSTNATNNTQVKSTTRPATFTKSQWDRATYNAYLSLVSLVKGSKSISEYITENADLFTRSGVPADEAHVVSLLVSMTRDTTVDGDKVRKVNPISSLRQFFNRSWSEKDALEVYYKAPAAPKESKPRTAKAKKTPEQTIKEYFGKMTPAEKAAFVANLMGEIAA